MKRSPFLSVGLWLLTILWRLVLTVAVIAALCFAGIYMLLDTVLCGPSETARDQLALTLLESDITREIPVRFLGESLVAQISAGATADVGTSDPSLIAMGTENEAEWQNYPDGVRTETVQGETYTAQVLLIRDFSPDAMADPVTAAPCKFMSFTAGGILILGDTAEYQQALGLASVTPCGPVLILDGKANEALLAGSSGYAPYTALGQRADGTVICVTATGWSSDCPGATYRDLINIMHEYGAVNACILGISEE